MNEQEIKSFLKNGQEAKDLLKVYLNNDDELDLFFHALNSIYKGKSITFSIWAFFISIYYFTYYKLYLEALVIMLFSLIASFLLKSSDIAIFVSLGVSVFCGINFFKFYFKTFFRRLKKSGYGVLNIEKVKENLKEKGGIDKMAYVIFGLLMLVNTFKIH